MITLKNSELANKNKNISPALFKISQLETLSGELKYKVTKVLKAYKDAIDNMGANFQTEVLQKFQDGLDDKGQPNIPEEKMDDFKAAQIAYGEIAVTLACEKLSHEELLKVDKITPEMVVGLEYLTDM